MGLSASWYAIRGYPAHELLAKFDLVETGAIAFLGDASLFLAGLSNGWTVVCAQDFAHFEAGRAGEFFPNSEVVACQMMQSMTAAEVRGFDRGRQTWRIAHRIQTEEMKVDVEGAVPEAYEAIAVERKRQQARARKRVDYLFEIPLDLAVAISGFRADQGCVPIDTVFKVVEKRLTGGAGERQRERAHFETELTSAVTKTLFSRAADLGFEPIEKHVDLHRFFSFGAANARVRDRSDHLEVIELFWGVSFGRAYVEIEFVAREKVKPRLARPGVAALPRPKETMRTMIFGWPKIEPEFAIGDAVSNGCSLLQAVDAYFKSGAVSAALRAPVYFDDMDA